MKKIKFHPLNDKVSIKRNTAETVTKGGIIIPDNAKKKSQQGVIQAVGKGNNNYTMTVKEGDEVLFGENVGVDIQINGEDHLIVQEGSLYGTIEYLDEE